jgi:hypothetical protein
VVGQIFDCTEVLGFVLCTRQYSFNFRQESAHYCRECDAA